MVKRSRKPEPSLQDNYERMRADYTGAKDSRFVRTRQGVTRSGRNADFHYRIVGDHLKLMERARDMDRNDVLIGQMVDRATDNTMQGGFTCDPTTRDRGVDRDLRARWNEYADEPDSVDLAGEMDFPEQENKVFRASLVDGDHFVVPNQTGALEMVEAHRCRRPSNSTRDNLINGILLDGNRKRLEYWFTKNDISPLSSLMAVGDVDKFKARDANGDRAVCHIYNPKRVSQTRGVTAFAPMFEFAGMFEDIGFAKLVQQQVAACWCVFRKRQLGFAGGADPKPTGKVTEETDEDGSVRELENIGPGMDVIGEPGEELTGFTPQVASTDFISHMKLIITLIGLNLGLPLVMGLMDASETNFSGWRGAIEQARMGFRANQRMMVRRFHRPVYRFKVRQWLSEDPTLNKLHTSGKINAFGHKWHLPSWPYIEPFKDAMSDVTQKEHGLNSTRRILAARGLEIDDIDKERIEDRMRAIYRAQRAADKFNAKYPAHPLTWEQVLNEQIPTNITPLQTQMVMEK